jgi:hypothetical protein
MTTTGKLVGPAEIVGGGPLAFVDGMAVAGEAGGEVMKGISVVAACMVAAVAVSHVRDSDKSGYGTGTEGAGAIGFTGVRLCVGVACSVGVGVVAMEMGDGMRMVGETGDCDVTGGLVA